jgi:hypothetical protein
MLLLVPFFLSYVPPLPTPPHFFATDMAVLPQCQCEARIVCVTQECQSFDARGLILDEKEIEINVPFFLSFVPPLPTHPRFPTTVAHGSVAPMPL